MRPLRAGPPCAGARVRKARAALGFLFLVSTAAAHDFDPRAAGSPFTTWSPQASISLPLLVLLWFYLVGWVRANAPSSDVGRRRRRLFCFLGGWLVLALSLISPLHALSELLFSAHMVQHELLMAVAAPLIVLGRAEVYVLCAVPPRLVSRATRTLRRSRIARLWSIITRPLVAWALHGAAIWLWHVPRFFDATLRSEAVHAAQHLCFFGSAVLFWQSVLHGTRRQRAYGAGVLYLFTTAVHSGGLGALLTFAPHPWYAVYNDFALRFGLTPLQDQQLGGLIMWVPGSLVYLAAGLVLFGSWLRASDRAPGASPAHLSLSSVASPPQA
jgi:cytochrome c oxidase assembly factor CtaG